MSLSAGNDSATGSCTTSCGTTKAAKHKPPPQQVDPCYIQRITVTADRHSPIEFLPHGTEGGFGFDSSVSEAAKKHLTVNRLQVLAKPDEPPDGALEWFKENDFQVVADGEPCTIMVAIDAKGCGAKTHPWIRVYKTVSAFEGKKITASKKAAAAEKEFEGEKPGTLDLVGSWLVGKWAQLKSWGSDSVDTSYYVLDTKGSRSEQFKVRSSPSLLVHTTKVLPSEGNPPLLGALRALWDLSFHQEQIKEYYLCVMTCPFSPTGLPKNTPSLFILQIETFPPDRYMFLLQSKNGYQKIKKQKKGTVEGLQNVVKIQRNDAILYETKPSDNILGLLIDCGSEQHDTSDYSLANFARKIAGKVGVPDAKYGFWFDADYQFFSGAAGITWRYKEQLDAHFVYPAWKATVNLMLVKGFCRWNVGMRVALREADEDDDSSWTFFESKLYLKVSARVQADGSAECQGPTPATERPPDGEVTGKVGLEFGLSTVVVSKLIDVKAGAKVAWKAVGEVWIGHDQPLQVNNYLEREDTVLFVRGTILFGLWEWEGERPIYGGSKPNKGKSGNNDGSKSKDPWLSWPLFQ